MLCSRSLHNPVWKYLDTFGILHPILFILKSCLSKTDLHPALQRFTIDIEGMCDSPGIR